MTKLNDFYEKIFEIAQRYSKQYWGTIITVLLIAFIAFIILSFVFKWGWTGFFSYSTTTTSPTGTVTQSHPGRTFWDLMGLLIIPLVLASGAILLNRAQRQRELEIAEKNRKQDLDIAEKERETEREIAKDREEERALQSYLDAMTKLLLEKDLRRSEEDAEVRSIARSRTLTILSSVNGERKGSILRFLYEAKLIDKKKTAVNLMGANLEGANLEKAVLMEVNLILANLERAKLILTNLEKAALTEANLKRVNLLFASLEGANLKAANLEGAFLFGAVLNRTNLSGADLSEADLSEADLIEANLNGAILKRANLRDADLLGTNLKAANLEGANLGEASYNSSTKWPEGFDPEVAGAIKVDDQRKAKNQD